MGFISELWDAAYDLGEFLILGPIERPDAVWLFLWIYLAGLAFLNSFILIPLLCRKFDPLFKKHVERRLHLGFVPYPSITALRAIQYAQFICFPKNSVKLVPEIKGFDFRGKIGRTTYVLCWFQLISTCYVVLVGVVAFVAKQLGIVLV